MSGALVLGLAMAWTAGSAAAQGTARPTATPPPTLTGEVLAASRCCFRRAQGPVIIGTSSFPYPTCDDQTRMTVPIIFSFSASGPTTDNTSYNPPPPAGTEPYRGTYDLTATIALGPGIHTAGENPRTYRRAVTGFSETFHISSPSGQVHGVKQLLPGSGAVLTCYLCQGAQMTLPLRYTATITPTGGGLFEDRGTSSLNMFYNEDPLIESLNETFASDLAAPQALPTRQSECRHGGWRSYDGRFKDKADCISFVKNEHWWPVRQVPAPSGGPG